MMSFVKMLAALTLHTGFLRNAIDYKHFTFAIRLDVKFVGRDVAMKKGKVWKLKFLYRFLHSRFFELLKNLRNIIKC